MNKLSVFRQDQRDPGRSVFKRLERVGQYGLLNEDKFKVILKQVMDEAKSELE